MPHQPQDHALDITLHTRITLSVTGTTVSDVNHEQENKKKHTGVAGKQALAVGAPAQADGLGLAALLANDALVELGLELVNLALLLEVEDDDAAGRRRAQPVPVRREHQRVDLVARRQAVQVLRLVQVPQHRRAVLAAGRAQRAVGRDGDGVDVAGVADVVGLDLAGRELPDLCCSLASCSCNADAVRQNRRLRQGVW